MKAQQLLSQGGEEIPILVSQNPCVSEAECPAIDSEKQVSIAVRNIEIAAAEANDPLLYRQFNWVRSTELMADHGYGSAVWPCKIRRLGLEGQVRLLRMHFDFLGEECCQSIVFRKVSVI